MDINVLGVRFEKKLLRQSCCQRKSYSGDERCLVWLGFMAYKPL